MGERWLARSRSSRVLLALSACLLLAVVSCQESDPIAPGVLPPIPPLSAAPQRIVSLAPSVTETLFALGLGDRVVGVTSYCDHPPEAKALPQVGDFVQHDIERILALKPDLVILGMGPGDVLETYRRLQDVSLASLVVRFDSLRDVFEAIDRIGRVTQRESEANALAESLNRQIARVESLVAGRPRPRVLYVYENIDFSLVVAGPDHYTSELIERAGGDNVAADAAVRYPRQSIEWVLDRDPEVIISTTLHQDAPRDPTAATRELWGTWSGLTAVRTGRVHAQELVRPGPRLGEGLRAMAALLHPEIAESLR